MKTTEEREQEGYSSISDLPSLSRNNGIIRMSFYTASDNLDDVLMGKFDAYMKAHRMDYELIENK